VSERCVDVTGISVSFGAREVLREVSFRVDAGELTGLIGTNGSGKTTLFRVMLGLEAPTSGAVDVVGGRGAIGYVPQKVAVDPGLPIRVVDLVTLGVDGNRVGLRRRSPTRDRAVAEMMEAVGVAHLAQRRVGELSGGELQRVLIAHALVGGPRLLLLDEPFSNLDPGSIAGIVTVLDEVAHVQGVAVLISAHDMNPLLGVMDRVVYIANGRAASGTTDEVVRPDVLSELYGHHVDVVRLHGRVIVVAGEGPDETPEHDEVVIT
jgi:zinc/manganese transport system ATP-binding protein